MDVKTGSVESSTVAVAGEWYLSNNTNMVMLTNPTMPLKSIIIHIMYEAEIIHSALAWIYVVHSKV